MAGKAKPIAPGAIFGAWTVLHEARRLPGYIVLYECRCVCGAVREVRAYHLRSGRSTSCGCQQAEQLQLGGARITARQLAWRAGITLDAVQERLRAGETPEQASGPRRRPPRYITHEGETLTLTGWAKRIGISRQALTERLERYPPEVALTMSAGGAAGIPDRGIDEGDIAEQAERRSPRRRRR